MPLRDAAAGNRKGRISLDRAHRITLNARNLDIALDRVTGHAQMMFERRFGGIFNDNEWMGVGLGNKRRRHRGGGADFPLAANLGARDAGPMLDDEPNGRGGQQGVAQGRTRQFVMMMQTV